MAVLRIPLAVATIAPFSIKWCNVMSYFRQTWHILCGI